MKGCSEHGTVNVFRLDRRYPETDLVSGTAAVVMADLVKCGP